MAEPICAVCGHPCSARYVDVGIGPYEYWGARGADAYWIWQSLCCEATIVNEEGREMDTWALDQIFAPDRGGD